MALFSSFRETVSSDFMAACQFLQDHMDNMENPSDEMVRRQWKIVLQITLLNSSIPKGISSEFDNLKINHTYKAKIPVKSQQNKSVF